MLPRRLNRIGVLLAAYGSNAVPESLGQPFKYSADLGECPANSGEMVHCCGQGSQTEAVLVPGSDDGGTLDFLTIPAGVLNFRANLTSATADVDLFLFDPRTKAYLVHWRIGLVHDITIIDNVLRPPVSATTYDGMRIHHDVGDDVDSTFETLYIDGQTPYELLLQIDNRERHPAVANLEYCYDAVWGCPAASQRKSAERAAEKWKHAQAIAVAPYTPAPVKTELHLEASPSAAVAPQLRRDRPSRREAVHTGTARGPEVRVESDSATTQVKKTLKTSTNFCYFFLVAPIMLLCAAVVAHRKMINCDFSEARSGSWELLERDEEDDYDDEEHGGRKTRNSHGSQGSEVDDEEKKYEDCMLESCLEASTTIEVQCHTSLQIPSWTKRRGRVRELVPMESAKGERARASEELADCLVSLQGGDQIVKQEDMTVTTASSPDSLRFHPAGKETEERHNLEAQSSLELTKPKESRAEDASLESLASSPSPAKTVLKTMDSEGQISNAANLEKELAKKKKKKQQKYQRAESMSRNEWDNVIGQNPTVLRMNSSRTSSLGNVRVQSSRSRAGGISNRR